MTTSGDLDNLRDVFTFEEINVSSYQLGNAQHGKMPVESMLRTPIDEEYSKNAILLETGESLQETLSGLQTKIQMVYFHVSKCIFQYSTFNIYCLLCIIFATCYLDSTYHVWIGR